MKLSNVIRTHAVSTTHPWGQRALLALCLMIVVVSTNAVARTTTNTYYPNGLLHTTNGPRSNVNDVTTYEYTTEGHLSKITNALGHETELLDHDARGNPGRLIDANGIETEFTYHPRGYLLTSTVVSSVGDLTTTFDYDAAGQVTGITLPDGSRLTYTYDDAQRLTGISNNLGERIQYTLDAAGNRTRERIRDGANKVKYTHEMAFDELSRLLDDVGANGQNTHIDYDLNGNPTAETDALNNQTSRAFDPLNRLKTLTDAKFNDVEYSYDSQDRIKSVIDQNGNVTTYDYNAFGDLLTLTSEATGTTTFVYDNAGNVTKRTDARGAITDYTYDALNRLLTVRYPGNAQEDVTYQYDDATNNNHGIGRLTSIVNSDASLTFVYDDRGNTTEVIQAVGGEFYSTDYAYDSADNVERITYPSGRIVEYTRDAIGQIIEVTSKANSSANTETVASGIAYMPYGPLRTMTHGNGLTTSATYDRDYRLTQLNTGNVQSKTFSYDVANNITGITAGVDPLKTQSFSYDELYYLSQDTGQYGSISYDYDAAGNRTEKVSTATDVLAAEDLVFTYNQANRMSSVTNNSVLLASYKYNALGQRVEKVRADDGSTTVYFYDLSGQVIAERVTDASGVITDREYVWLDSKPVAMFVNEDVDGAASRSTVYIHTDHLNTPRLATSPSQQVVWRWDSDAFGVGEANSDPDGDGNGVTISLRFPGQLKDDEVGLHYNYFRDYDARTGRYIQSDPIGLEGGLNTYAYVGGNPINYIDPTGEIAIAIPFIPTIITGTDIAIGALIAAVASIPGDSAQTQDRAIPQPTKPKRGVTCTCRASSSGQQEGNCPEDEFAFGTATAPTKRQARAEAERIARRKLGKQAKHTQCKCTDNKGSPVF